MQNYAQNPFRPNPEAAQLNRVLNVQIKCKNLPPKEAREVLCAEFPHKTDSFFKRNLQLVLSISPEDFIKLVGHSDPTAKTAIRNLERQAA